MGSKWLSAKDRETARGKLEGIARRWRSASAFVAAAVACLGLAIPAKAQTDSGKPTISVPGIGKARSAGFMSSSGAVVETLPLDVAPGRKQIQPNLLLSYASLAGMGDLGLGWSIEIGRIVRSPAQGIPTGSNLDEFLISLGAGAETLVPVGGGAYRPRFESVFRQHRFEGDSWEVVDAQGVTYSFGSTPASRIDGLAWMLDRVEDTNGNAIYVTYQSDGGSLYPSEIEYTAHGPRGESGSNRVVFEYEARPDASLSYALGVEQRKTLRLRRVSNFAGSELVRRYELGYDSSSTSHRSLLSGVELIGSDDTFRVQAREFEYEEGSFAFAASTLDNRFPVAFRDGDGRDTGARTSDVNGDGFLDVTNNGTQVWLGDGAGSFVLDATWSASLDAAGVRFVDGDALDAGTRLVDVNGDMRPDLVVAPTPAQRRVLLNTGTGWTSSSPLAADYEISLQQLAEEGTTLRRFVDPSCETMPLPECDELVPFVVDFSLVAPNGDANGTSFADVNADGLTDLVWSFSAENDVIVVPQPDPDAGADPDAGPNTGPGGQTEINRVPVSIRAVFLNTGAGWILNDDFSVALEAVPAFVVDTQVQGFDVLDVNGDGAADIVNTASADPDPRRVWLSTGTGWLENADFTSSLRATSIVSIAGEKAQGLLPTDFNGDGRIDYIRADESIQVAYRNTGLGWVEDAQETQVIVDLGLRFADGDGIAGPTLLDVNGDGVSDITFSRSGHGNFIRLAVGPLGDRLSRITTALGEETSFDYAPSTHFDHADADGVEQMPTMFYVATELTRFDGRGNSFTTTATYAGGFVGQERSEAARFRSFAVGSSRDSRGVLTVRYFEQSEALAGAVTVNETYDASDVLVSRSSATYTTRDAGGGITQILLEQKDDETFDPGGTLHTRMRYVYDEHLNTTDLFKDGQVGVSGDEGHTQFTYAKNLARGIVSPIAKTLVFDATGALHSKSTIYYDESHDEGFVVRGNATKTVDFVGEHEPSRVRKFDFDAYGNPKRVIDGRGHASLFFYDPTHTFRVKSVDPMGRTTKSEFDPRFGAVIEETDASGNVTTRLLDPLGRIVRETLPGDECSPFGTRVLTHSALGDPTAQFVQLSATETPGSPETQDTRTLFDGFGQIYRIETEGAAGVPIVIRNEFDDAGNQFSVSEPFFAGDAVSFRTMERDALRRPLRVVDSRGAESFTIYRGASREEVDARGNRAIITSDAYGNTVEVRQFVGSSVLVTRTEYNAVGDAVKIVNPAGEVTRIRYDALGRKTKLVDPALGTFSYDYDGNGNLTKQSGPTGRFSFEYNKSNDLVEKKYPDGRVTRFEYGSSGDNAVGRVVRMDDAAGSLELEYDPRGNVVEKRREIAGRTYLTAYSHDSQERLRQVTYPDGYEVLYAYNAAGHVESIEDGDARPIVPSISYNAQGRITHIEFANGVASDYSFDAAGLPLSIDTENGAGEVLQALSYAIDPNRNVTEIEDRRTPGRSQVFGYDEIDRLTSASGGYGDETYQYDEIGNFVRKANLVFARDEHRLQQVTCAIDLNLADRHTNGIEKDKKLAQCLDRLLEPGSGVSPADRERLETIRERSRRSSSVIGQSMTISYDDAGNMVRRGDRKLRYDSENYLLEVEDEPHGHGAGETLEENLYDAAGNRLLRRADGSETVFVDGIYEEERGAHSKVARRHVRLGSTVIATAVVPLKRVDLIKHVERDLLSACKLAAGGGGHPPHPDPDCGIASQNGGPTLPLLLLVASILATRRRRNLKPIWTTVRAIAGGVADRLRRSRWLGGLSMLLVVVQVLNYAQPAFAHGDDRSGGHGEHDWRGDRHHDRGRHDRGGHDGRGHGGSGHHPHATPGELHFYHLDHIGNTNVITDETGAEFARREYRPFGEQDVRAGSDDLETSLNGHLYDREVGLYYFGARHYDPLLGRFVTADTQVPDESPQALHRYVFNLNNPLRYVDLTGHDFFDWVVGAVIVILVVVAVIAISVATLGVGTVGLVLLAAAAGAAIGGAAALAYGYFYLYKEGKISLGEVGALFLAGFLVGALVGASVGVAIAGGFAASAAPAFKIGANAILGGATGAIGGGTIAAINGAPPEELLGAIVTGAIIGAAIGALSAVSSTLIIKPQSFPAGILKDIFGNAVMQAIASGASSGQAGYLGTAWLFEYKNVPGQKYMILTFAFTSLLAAGAGVALAPFIGSGGERPGAPPPGQTQQQLNAYPTVP